MITINNNLIETFDPCEDGYADYLREYPNWEGTIREFLLLENIDPENKLWLVLRPEIIEEKLLHELACQIAERVLPIFEKEHPDDKRPRIAIKAKRKFLKGEITEEELAGARDAARDAAWDGAASAGARAAGAAASAGAASAGAASAGAAAWAASASAGAAANKQVITDVINIL